MTSLLPSAIFFYLLALGFIASAVAQTSQENDGMEDVLSDNPSMSPSSMDVGVEEWKTLQIGFSDYITYLQGGTTAAVGDIFTWDRSNKIYFGENLGDLGNMDLFGDNEGYCIRVMVDTSVEANHQWSCTFTIYKDGGQITAQGPFNNGMTEVTIMGGTGIYTGITGYMVLGYAGEYVESDGNSFFVYYYNFYIQK